MDISRRSRIETLMSQKKFADVLMLLADTINCMQIERETYTNDDLVWAVSQRSICFRHLGQFPYAYDDARNLIKKRPTLAVGYLRKAEVELEVGLTEQAVGTLSLWQHKRPGTNGDDDSGAAEAIHQLKAAREKHRTAMNEKRRNERSAKAIGWVAASALAIWLCGSSFDPWMIILCLLLGVIFSYFFVTAVRTLSRTQEDQRRDTLVDLSGSLMQEDER